jgi:hypothetical protein
MLEQECLIANSFFAGHSFLDQADTASTQPTRSYLPALLRWPLKAVEVGVAPPPPLRLSQRSGWHQHCLSSLP